MRSASRLARRGTGIGTLRDGGVATRGLGGRRKLSPGRAANAGLNSGTFVVKIPSRQGQAAAVEDMLDRVTGAGTGLPVADFTPI